MGQVGLGRPCTLKFGTAYTRLTTRYAFVFGPAKWYTKKYSRAPSERVVPEAEAVACSFTPPLCMLLTDFGGFHERSVREPCPGGWGGRGREGSTNNKLGTDISSYNCRAARGRSGANHYIAHVSSSKKWCGVLPSKPSTASVERVMVLDPTPVKLENHRGGRTQNLSRTTQAVAFLQCYCTGGCDLTWNHYYCTLLCFICYIQ